MESELYRSRSYPTAVLEQVQRMGPLAVTIANRWMRGWPKAVQAHLRNHDYLTLLRHQEQLERIALGDTTTGHLAMHEIMELYGFSPKPPMPETYAENL